MRKKGFTLIELLVVIAIIALLMAILMPALRRAKRQAQSVICQTCLKQWGLVFTLYAQDNEDSFPQSVEGNGVNAEDAWILGATLPYYKELDLRMCPTTKTIDRTPEAYLRGGTFTAWGPFPPSSNGSKWWDSLATGSYGFNEWCADPPPGRQTFWDTLSCENAIRKTTTKGADNIPLVLYQFRLITALACVISSEAQRSREIWLMYLRLVSYTRFLHFRPLRGPPVEMTKAHNLIVIDIRQRLR